MSKPDTILEPGALKKLRPIIRALRGTRILIVTGKKLPEMIGAKELLDSVLASYEVEFFTDFSANPTYEDIQRAAERLKTFAPDAIVALGGGSAMDVAKIASFMAEPANEAFDIMGDLHSAPGRRLPLIVVPTTAGTGSEATHFAVMYRDGLKHSVAHASLLPDYALLDPNLILSAPTALAASAAADALCQAIEAYWSKGATLESRQYSLAAAKELWATAERHIHSPTVATAMAMLRGAHLAGRAINITKTTGAHALSYTLTARFGVPHGQAVAVTLPAWIEFNAQAVDNKIWATLDAGTATEAARGFREFLRALGLATRLTELGVTKPEHFQALAANVNAERLGNNPRPVSPGDIREIIHASA
jgi:alcohol dehydrogenase class IV